MGDRRGLALVVGFTYLLVQWWHSHEALFDDRTYGTFITVEDVVFLDLQYCWHPRWRHDVISTECLGWIGAIGWLLGAMMALKRGTVQRLLRSLQAVTLAGLMQCLFVCRGLTFHWM